MADVAIVGAGPAGLVTARYLKSEGFDPVLFEQGDRVGGQWTGDARYSGVWPSMRTNTSRVMTAFSDLDYPEGAPVFPTNQMVRDYLEAYAEQFDLLQSVRLGTAVEKIERDAAAEKWIVRSKSRDGKAACESFNHVVVASGRYHKPLIPAVPGLDTFAGKGGVSHTFAYKNPEQYRGMRVVVAGCSISALEIASDLAMLGAASVTVTVRRQRYVFHKLLAGVPTEHVAFTRFAVLAAECMPMEVVAGGLKDLIVKTSGSPEQFGAPKPADSVLEAGITQCQHFLPLVAEGRICVRPWIQCIEGSVVHFMDGSTEEADALIFGTGYELDLPFLSDELKQTLNPDSKHIDLFGFTFHPDLPGLGFVGQLDLVGPYFPVLELQARWLAYTWSGAIPGPDREEMEAGLAVCRARRNGPSEVPMHMAAIQFARAAGVEPDAAQWPGLTRALYFGPLSPASFRLQGRDSLADAPRRTAESAEAFGAVPTPELTPDQKQQLDALASAQQGASLYSISTG
ncbi:MAG: NAD(P)-binding domain-containing protein [Candidatus Hydrogenedentes bacterium]|nr:NAD(P)-binding domain-containing protein [Candidatus Hydrogenedentota bacterium]